MHNLVVLTDFDGTMAAEDVGHRIVVEYAEEGWREKLKKLHDGKVGSAEFYAFIYGAMTVGETELRSAVAETGIRAGFKGFYQYLKEREMPLYIVSDGFDFYIDPILENHGLSEIGYFSNHLEYNQQKKTFEVAFPGSNPDCDLCGNCKAAIVQQFLQQGKRVIYIGDGTSDFYASSIADLTFAKDKLAEYCQENGVRYLPFNDYNDILDHLKENPVLNFNFKEVSSRKCIMRK